MIDLLVRGAFLAITVALSGCASTGAASGGSSIGLGEYALPAAPPGPEGDYACGDTPIYAVLDGDPKDSRITWAMQGTKRIELDWLPGYRARFNPNLEILDERGDVIWHEGALIGWACWEGSDDLPFWVGQPGPRDRP